MKPKPASRLRMRLLAGLLTAAGALLSLAALAVPSAAGQDSLTVSITPHDDWSPAAVTDLAASAGGEGQLLLQWTAPDGNGGAFSQTQTASSYRLRIATFPVTSVGSTTAWWNSATAVTPPTPAPAGSLETSLLNNLEPGATYWAAVISLDSVGNVSPVDTKTAGGATQAQRLVSDLAPSAPSGLHVVSVGSAAIQIAWNASAASDLWYYNVYADSTAPYDFSDAVVVAVASGTAPALDYGGLPLDTTVYFRVTAVDKGAPTYLGHALESAASASVSASTVRPLTRPLTPYGIWITTGTNNATVGWMPVEAYESGIMFTDPRHPSSVELTGYHVYRATAPTAAPWTDLVAVSSSAASYTDNTAVPGSYYMVRAYNPAGLSQASMVRGNLLRNAFVVGFDGQTTFQMADDVATISVNGEGQQSNAYLVVTSSHPEQLSETVVKSLEFTAMKQGIIATPNAKLSNPGMLMLHYDMDPATGQVTPSGLRGFGASAYRPSANGSGTPDQLSVFWNNGNKWVQLYGKLDPVAQVVAVQTPYLGQYQLRTAQRTQGFQFNSANVSNRMVTPNGDGKNDDVLFTFDNPAASEVVGHVFDARGREIATMVPGPINPQGSLLWDGKSNGKWVPGGVYIYEIKAEGQTHTGSIIVIK